MMSDLQAADKIKLKIYANSTRRALWHARLGYYRSSRPPVMSLHSLFGDGGPVPGVDVIVLRIYPILVCIAVKTILLYYFFVLLARALEAGK